MHNIDRFYHQYKTLLEDHYPGITLPILQRQLKDAPHVQWDHSIQEKLIKGMPLEYITKQKFFWDSFFYVDERVLIPRMESELLIDNLLSEIKEGDDLCEVGVGSGALFLSVAKCIPDLNIVATDICEKALQVTEINVYRMNYRIKSSKIKLVQTDRLLGIEQKFDFIMTNPPYIKKSDKNHVHKNVHEYEPHSALYLDDNDYEAWFSELFIQVKHCLKDNGRFIMEGHEFHLKSLKKLAQECGLENVKLENDLTNRKRFLTASK